MAAGSALASERFAFCHLVHGDHSSYAALLLAADLPCKAINAAALVRQSFNGSRLELAFSQTNDCQPCATDQLPASLAALILDVRIAVTFLELDCRLEVFVKKINI